MTKRKKPSKADLDRSARALLAFLERNRQERIFDYPFGYSYPQNCCESVSLILTYLLEAKYGLDNVQIIKGTNHRHEHHLWVMVGDLIYDLTAQQFVGKTPSSVCLLIPSSWTPFLIGRSKEDGISSIARG